MTLQCMGRLGMWATSARVQDLASVYHVTVYGRLGRLATLFRSRI